MNKEVIKNTSLFHTRQGLIINTDERSECDKPSENKYVTDSLFAETAMEEQNFKQFETDYNGFKVVLEFPCESELSEKEECIQDEVKKMMSSLLDKQLENIL